MPPDDKVRVRHLVEAAGKAVSYAAGRNRDDLDDDELLRLALTKLVEIVGEAAKHVSNDLRESHPEVPWSATARMRDRLVHHYFDINLDVLWSTVTEDLPRLLAILPNDLVPDSSAPTAHDQHRIDEH
ncbi:MAG: HepT-like ribonuclease domain-containing protein [Pseudonocardiaceae bacterium]